MRKTEFDQYAEKYDDILGSSIPDGLSENQYFAEYKIKLISSLLSAHEPKKILDFGCGSGRSLPYLLKYFSNSEIWGFDVSPVSLEVAKQKATNVNFISDWELLRENSFDLIICANVFHHIPPEERISALTGCNSALDADGNMFIFEHNPYNPVTRWIFEHCPFDTEAEMLTLRETLKLSKRAGLKMKDSGYTLFFPAPLSYFRRFEPVLKSIPFGAQYYVQLEK